LVAADNYSPDASSAASLERTLVVTRKLYNTC
jgi:hypothetical protein